MVELADTQDLGSCASQRAGSTPVTRTIIKNAVSGIGFSAFLLSYHLNIINHYYQIL